MTLRDVAGRNVAGRNVAGPHEPLHLAGVPIERVMFWVPHPGKELGMGISILSYCGMATLAVIADAHLVPDPEAITQEFNREFAAMLKAVRARKAPVVKTVRRATPMSKRVAGTTRGVKPVRRVRAQARA